MNLFLNILIGRRSRQGSAFEALRQPLSGCLLGQKIVANGLRQFGRSLTDQFVGLVEIADLVKRIGELLELVRRGLPVGSFGDLGGVGSQHGGCRFDCLLVGSALLSLSVLRISDQTQNQRRWRKYGCNANWPFQESERDRLACI